METEYPNWKESIPEKPTKEQFLDAWKTAFNSDFDECQVMAVWNENNNYGLVVRTPEQFHINGVLVEYTEEPVGVTNVYFHGSDSDEESTWAEDANGQRFLLLDRETNLPYSLEEGRAHVVLRRSLGRHLDISGLREVTAMEALKLQ